MLNKWWLPLTFTLSFLSLACGNCMVGKNVVKSFMTGDYCYWTIASWNLTSLNSLVESCKSYLGNIAVIHSDANNIVISSNLDRPAFIGYHKTMDGSWRWIDSNVTYTKPFVENGGVHMVIDKSGNWLATNIDSTGYMYEGLCYLALEPHLRCPSVSAENATSDKIPPYYSGHTVTFTCKNGTQVTVGRTIQIVTCLPGGKWSYPVLGCDNIKCSLIDPPAYTYRSSEAHFVGDKVLYTCSEADKWFSPGSAKREYECMPSGEWSSPIIPCKAIRCAPPPFLPMGRITNMTTLWGHSITYSCENGYRFADGSKERTFKCLGDPPDWSSGGWNMSSFKCIEISCGEDPITTGGDVKPETPNYKRVGLFQTWYCSVGYRNPGTNAVVTSTECIETGDAGVPIDWSRSIPACLQVGCPEIKARNTTRNAYQPIYPFEYKVIYTCNGTDLYFPGGFTSVATTCEGDGTWSTGLALSGCLGSNCEPGWQQFRSACYYISDATSLGLRYKFAEKSCEDKLAHLAQITSLEEAEWLSKVTYEIHKKDFWIGFHVDILTGNWTWYDVSSSNFTYWAEGYPENYNCSRTSVRGFWKDRNCDDMLPYVCKKTIICSVAPEIENGFPISLPNFPANVGDKITYKCNPGYRFKDGSFNKTIFCQEGGWFNAIENCITDLCPPIYAPKYLVGNSSVDSSSNRVGSKVTFTCMDGFLFPNRAKKMSMECLVGGNWTALPPHCEELKCLIPAVPATKPEFGYSSWGDMDYYSCEPGYSFQDAEVSKLFTCTKDGTWTPTDQTCIRRACPKYSLAFAKVAPNFGSYGDKITVECFQGFVFLDTFKVKTLTCTANGTWDQDLEPCIQTKCPGPTPPNVTNAYRNTDAITSGTTVNYTCLFDFVFINGDKSRIAYCDTETLEWVNVPSDCVEFAAEIEARTFPPKEAKDAVTYGAVGIVILVTFVVAVITLDAITFSRFIPSWLKKTPEKSSEFEAEES